MPKWGWVFLTLLTAGVVSRAPAHGAWTGRARCASREMAGGAHYFSPSVADDGTIVAPRQWAR